MKCASPFSSLGLGAKESVLKASAALHTALSGVDCAKQVVCSLAQHLVGVEPGGWLCLNSACP